MSGDAHGNVTAEPPARGRIVPMKNAHKPPYRAVLLVDTICDAITPSRGDAADRARLRKSTRNDSGPCWRFERGFRMRTRPKRRASHEAGKGSSFFAVPIALFT